MALMKDECLAAQTGEKSVGEKAEKWAVWMVTSTDFEMVEQKAV